MHMDLEPGTVKRSTDGEYAVFTPRGGGWVPINESTFSKSLDKYDLKVLVKKVSVYAHKMANNHAGEWDPVILKELEKAMTL